MRSIMATVIFTRIVHLPRFVMQKGEQWRVRVERLTDEGFNLGGGFVSNDNYCIEDRECE